MRTRTEGFRDRTYKGNVCLFKAIQLIETHVAIRDLVLRRDQDKIAAEIIAHDSVTESETESDHEILLASLQKQKARLQLAPP